MNYGNLSCLITLFIQNVLFAQDSLYLNKQQTSWSISSECWNYCSFSQQKTSMRMKASYPVITTQTLAFGISYYVINSRAKHELRIAFSIPSSLSSDNGSGENLLLKTKNSTYFRSELDYRLSFFLFQWKQFKARHSFVSGSLYEDRKLYYISQSIEGTRDINFYIGPGTQLQYDLPKSLSIEARFDGRFYLPYTNYGEIISTDTEGAIFFSTVYRAFYYQTIFKLGITHKLPQQSEIQVGMMKNNLVGFANRKPIFYVNDIVHFKFDRLLQFYLSYKF